MTPVFARSDQYQTIHQPVKFLRVVIRNSSNLCKSSIVPKHITQFGSMVLVYQC